jgi:hypothetical protein
VVASPGDHREHPLELVGLSGQGRELALDVLKGQRHAEPPTDQTQSGSAAALGRRWRCCRLGRAAGRRRAAGAVAVRLAVARNRGGRGVLTLACVPASVAVVVLR